MKEKQRYTAEQLSDAEELAKLLAGIPAEERKLVCKTIKRYIENQED